jgi:Ca-activated chloride channel family protein
MRDVLLGFLFVATFCGVPAWAGSDCTEDAMIVFDGSGSMSEMGFNLLDQPRIFDARQAVRRAMPRVAPFRRLGLIVYGPGQKTACENIDLRFTPIPAADGPIIAAVDALEPKGETPLTEAVRRAADVLDYTRRPATVVLVTDGKETCGGLPCELAADLAADGVDLTVHVIGFKVRSDYFSWDSQDDAHRYGYTVAQCLANRTGGKYVDAETVDELVQALQETLGCPLFSAASALSGPGVSLLP